MNTIKKTLSILENSISSGKYIPVETEKIELKDLSQGSDWREFHKSICAFLNTEGGILIIGIKEKEKNGKKEYILTGYKENNENKIKDELKVFKNDKGKALDLSDSFPNPRIIEFLDKRIAIVYVEKLSEVEKYAFYKGHAYKRQFTGDHKISAQRIKEHNELKEDIKAAYEIQIFEDSELEDLDIDTLNEYILRLNSEIKIESIKSDIVSALPFLEKKKFTIKKKPSILGLLVCAKEPYTLLGGRCQIDCYTDSNSQFSVTKNKKVLKDNVIPLMESAVNFVFQNISIGVGYEGGGERQPEYPERLIREVVNNALAHRDYNSEKFVNIIIKPHSHIEIRNPGAFREDQKLVLEDPVRIRRIIPNPKPKNPRLADILKTFDRWEGRGLGMASLTNACLENKIDVPYFILKSENDVSLFVQSGKVLDDFSSLWLDSFSGWITQKCNGRNLSIEAQTVLAYFHKSELLNMQEKYTILLTADNNHFQVLNELERYDLIQKKDIESVHPLFIVNPTLMKSDFFTELRAIYGGAFDWLSSDYKDVLEIIYRSSIYGMEKAISSRNVDRILFFKDNKGQIDLKKYDSFSRKIRNITSKLTKKGFLRRTTNKRPLYTINLDFDRTPSLWDKQDA